MIVSKEQAELAVRCHSAGASGAVRREPAVREDVLARARSLAAAAPELREDRVREARARMAAGGPDSHELAEKMLCRMVCDSLR